MNLSPKPHSLREEIAAAAARLIADGGLDYASAKRKAQSQVFGASANLPRNALPDNELIDAALREHLSLFDDEHPARVQRRRQAALELMEILDEFDLHLTGAVWKGIVTEDAPIHLQSFSDNAKEMAMTLLNRGVRFDSVTLPHFKGSGQTEAMTFYWRNEPVILAAYESREYRGAPRNGSVAPDRGNRAALVRRMAE